MRHEVITTISISIFLMTTSWSPPAWPVSPDPVNAEELFARSGLAYRAMPMVDISFSTRVEMPNAEPGRRVTHYLLGEEGEAVIEIGSIMRVVTNATNIYAELPGHDDRYLAIEAGENLPSGLARLRGRSSLAGLWNPVPAALRDALGTAEILDAFRYSRYLGELSIAGFKHLPGPVYEVLLEADNGSCRARFDGATFFLQDLEYLVHPPNTPTGYTVRINGNFETQSIAYDRAPFQFNDSGRLAVDSLRQLSPTPPGISQPSEAVVSDQMLSSHLIQIEDLAASLKDKDVLLVGEDHLYEEPPRYLAELLNSLDDRPVSLLLEMPMDIQVEIDQYMEDGSESTLDGIFKGRMVLQLQDLLRWAKENSKQVRAVKAIDEPLHEIFLKRAYLDDTRNPTMAAAIHREWQAHPKRRVVVYAGQLHLMKAGRYKENRPSRNTAGSRLPGLGIPADKTAVIWLNGGENFHLHESWKEPGVLALEQFPVRIPIPYLLDYPIFGIEYADEALDYFVNLGQLTKIEVDVK